MEVIRSLFDFILPRICPACENKLTADEEIICEECFAKIKLPDKKYLSIEYAEKFGSDRFVDQFRPLFIFEKESPVQALLHQLKYKRRFAVGKFLGKLIALNMSGFISEWKPDLITPVPLHRIKKAERGFNQTDYIVRGLGSSSGIAYNLKILERIRYTSTQTFLHKEERIKNVEGAFRVKNNEEIRNKAVLLVDDVITTGATTNEAAKALKSAGAERVCAVSAAAL